MREAMKNCQTMFDLKMFGADVPVVSFPTKAVVFVKGEQSDQAYVIKKGQVQLRLSGRTLETADRGCMVGEVGLLYPHPRVASGVAIGDTELFVIDRELFGRLCVEYPDFSIKVMQLIARRWGGALDGLAESEGLNRLPQMTTMFRRAMVN